MTQEDYDNLREFVDNHKHLPSFMRDFHDQKDLFKTIGSGKSPNPMNPTISVTDGMCYTIDNFLWVMAMHGYTLQKCRAKKPFVDIHHSISAREAKETSAFKQMLENASKKKEAEKVGESHE